MAPRRIPMRRPVSAAALLCCAAGLLAAGRPAYVPTGTDGGRRGFLAAVAGASLASGAGQSAWGFSPSDLGMAEAQTKVTKRAMSKDELQQALYLISRVQEATVQQERLVTTGKFKDMQRNSIKMALNMMLDNYKLGDQIVVASAYAGTDKALSASQAGNEAIDVLETAKEYFSKELKVSGLTDVQRTFIVDAMSTTRNKLDSFLTYMPEDTVAAARKQVEDENDANMREYKSPDGTTIMNPVKLPWQK
jgi:hypothetical protein